jgi:shikimate kinase
VSILNGLATGKGGAVSIALSTEASVTVSDGPGRILFSNKQIQNEGLLAEVVVRRTLEHYGYDGRLHCEVKTSSDIPPSVGLKSSSAAANAIALATISAMDEQPRDDDLIKIGMDASVESHLSLTGAFDDSYASYHGGAVLTDNEKRIVEGIPEISKNLRILLLIPGTRDTNVPLHPSHYSSIRKISQLAYSEALNGQIWEALTLNGLAFSSLLRQDPAPSLAALGAGALGAGLSGKGPAIAAIATRDTCETIRQSMEKFGGKVIETWPNFAKASIEP